MKLIELVKSIAEEADSFARKVEKKHPLLKKLVEELYRAFHMLANAFPDQLSIYLQFDRIPETPQDLQTEDGPQIPEKEIGMEGSKCDAHTDETEVEALKKALKTLQAEKESFHLLYQLSLHKLSTMELERRILNELENGILQAKEDNFKLIELCKNHPDEQLGEIVQKDETLGKKSHLDREVKAQVEVLEDLEQKDSSESFVEALELSETEIEAVEQQLGTEFLWDEIENLKKELLESNAARGRVEKQISELFQICGEQKEEIKHICDLNRNLASRKGFLSLEIEEPRVREKYVCSEQEDRSKELELWDTESASFHFDLPMSAAREVLFETKAQEELTGSCENSSVGSSESEIRKPKTKLSAYVPVVSSLKHDIESPKKSAVIRRESKSRHADKALRSQRTQNGIRDIEQWNMKKQGNLRLSHKREDSSCESVGKFEVSRSFPDKAKILKRLGSGSRKLMSVSTTVKDLKTRIEKWERNGRTQSSDLEKARRQLKEMEDSVTQLIHTNDALTNDVKKQRM